MNKNFKGFLQKRVESAIKPLAEQESKNHTLATMSAGIRAALPAIQAVSPLGIDNVRKQIIKAIESDMKRFITQKHIHTAEDLIRAAVNTPEYMALLNDVGLNRDHLELLEKEAIAKYEK